MGTVLKRMGRFSDAHDCYDEAERFYNEVDDKLGRTKLMIGRADLAWRLGDLERAFSLATEALKEAATIDNKPNMLDALVVITRVSDDPEHLERAEELVRQLHLERELTLLRFNALSVSLIRGNDAETVDAAEIISELTDMADSIEVPTFCLTAAEYLMRHKDYETSYQLVDRARKVAKASGLVPELITALTMQGKLDVETGSYESGYQCYKQALELSRRIASDIRNESQREQYRRQPSVAFLVEAIRSLAQRLAAKKAVGAATTPT
jgi:tetratricopeptide (TPR) repeat protein